MVADPSKRQPQILIIDDDPQTLKMIQMVLEWDGYLSKTLESPPNGDFQAIKNEFDLILLDLHFNHQMDGLEWLQRFKQSIFPDFTPVMIISGDSDTASIVRGLDLGADDYIVKPFSPAELVARIRSQLRIGELTSQLRAANAQLQQLVEIDDLTGLFNMRSMYQKISNEIERAKRYNRNVCVVMMDIDHFKSVNDGHDHLFGSFVLGQVGRLIRHSIRTVDVAARYGGDEFLILLTETTPEGAQVFCERLLTTIREHTFQHGPDSIKLTSSLGFALVNPSIVPIDAQSLVRHADHALYEAKREGRNQIKSRVLANLSNQAA